MKLNLNEVIPEAQAAKTIIKPIQNKTSKLRAAKFAENNLQLKKTDSHEVN